MPPKETKAFELLVFDWDGTLMDSAARIVDCMRSAVMDLGLALPEDEAIRNIIGLGLKEAMNRLFPGIDDEGIQALTGRYRHHFIHENATPSGLFDGVHETLRDLASQGYLLAVATGKGRSGLDRALNHTELGSLFHATRCADEALSKPHPEMLIQIMDELGVRPGDTLMVGDTEYDMQMAGNAGTWALGVSYGVHTPERLSGHGPLGCLDDITHITDWLEDRKR